ncbi:lipopolysaccharide kinase InaA family protein [Alloalcanivorax profundimaris]|uniref:lipopolysaccharide kinase InaA family protein n=1 Tax=Alloalcanivorax profundimaris TaxID=2735259 RepID=UPI00188874EA|nr:lipopolysaccharide kinase InaA family protein [Alloalcanivorax profundimaris]MBF1801094.1 lipopolysaccharide kinase [Alloalcanivorax profundimaris]MCQ6260758.1 lipopolysaccharide kinase InaA family protein [Alcanivorax sp. MM125-6]
MKSQSFIASDWRTVLLTLGLNDLDAWWTLPDAELVDEPNRRYGGEMSVYRVRLADAEGHPHSLYIKRQCDQLRRSVVHPLHGEPTLVKEFRALVDCLKQGVPVARPLFFESRMAADGHCYTVLVSLGLDGFESLDRLDLKALSRVRRWRLLQDVAEALRYMHSRGMAHGTLYPKHIFVAWRPSLGRFDVRFIDLEKARHSAGAAHRLRDMESLSRRSQGVSLRDRLRFLRAYLGRPRLKADDRRLLRQLAPKKRQS